MPFLNKIDHHDRVLITSIGEGRYWYLSFFDKESISKKNISPFILSRLQQGILTLLLDNFFEGFTDIVEVIYQKFVVEMNIPEENIILLSENADILAEVIKVSETLNLKSIKCKWIRRLEYAVSNQINSSETEPTLQHKSYTKKFLNFNRRWRLHRPMFVAFLKVRNLLDKGHVSLCTYEDGSSWNLAWGNILDFYKAKPVLYEQLKTHETEIKNLPPMTLDFDDLSQVDLWLCSSANNPEDKTFKLYLDTYFSLVSETVYYSGSGRMLTEKTFKPIGLKHPFLIIGGALSLEALRGIGYKTFSPYINEDYDTELDDIKRMQMILDETERLCYLSDEELDEFLTGAREICEFNYNVLKNKTTFTTDLN